MNDKENNCDADTGIGHVERRPRMREGHMQIEEREIDDVTVEETVREVAHDPGQQERQGNVPEPIAGTRPAEKQREDKHERHTREHDEKSVVVLEGTERRAGVGNVDQMKEGRDHYRRLVWID